MLARCLFFALSCGLSALASGCLLDASPYQSGGTGAATTSSNAGGEGGTGGGATMTTTTTTDATAGSGGATTTTTIPECDSQDDCIDADPCTQDVCDVDTCKHVQVSDGTLVADDAPTDCVKTVCDAAGAVVTVADDDDTPPADANECDLEHCADKSVQHSASPDGTLCGAQPAEKCQESVCVVGQCKIQGKADYTPLPDNNPQDCAALACYMGVPYYFAQQDLCVDPDQSDCTLHKCGVNGSGGYCYTQQAPSGMACGSAGSGDTCHGNGACY